MICSMVMSEFGMAFFLVIGKLCHSYCIKSNEEYMEYVFFSGKMLVKLNIGMKHGSGVVLVVRVIRTQVKALP